MSRQLRILSPGLPNPQKPYALLLDIDGTLAPIMETPDAVKIPQDTLRILARLKNDLDSAVALVSGRSISSIDSLCDGNNFVAAGQHGLEIRFESGSDIVLNGENGAVIDDIYEQVKAFHQDYPKLLVEYKGLSVAVHYRTAPELKDVVQTLMSELVAPYKDFLSLQEGKMVFEVRLRGADKGMAIEQLMQHPDFVGKLPVFAGDDLTDENGFSAVNKMGGISIKVGDGRTVAQYRASDITEFQEWLRGLAT